MAPISDGSLIRVAFIDGWRCVHTHFGVGYRFAAERVPAGQAAGRPMAAPAVPGGVVADPEPPTAYAYAELTPDTEAP